MTREYQVFEQGQIVYTVEAASARGALRTAARQLPRRASDYYMDAAQPCPATDYWETWFACRPGQAAEASAQVRIPATGTLRGAGRSVYRAV